MALYRGAYKELNNVTTLNFLVTTPMRHVVKVLPIDYFKGGNGDYIYIYLYVTPNFASSVIFVINLHTLSPQLWQIA